MFKRIIKLFLSNVVLYRIGRKNIYLTFDDGPVPEITSEVLDLLKRHNVEATFFIEGRKAEKSPQFVFDMISDGHSIGYHTYSHRPIHEKSWRELLDLCSEIKKFNEDFVPNGGHPIFRPPYGKLSLKAIIVLWLKRIKICMWSADSRDSHHVDTETIIASLSPGKIRGGDIILMHDDNKIAMDVLPDIINKLKTAGFRFDTIR